MAPTEILAEQHYRTMKGLLEPLKISVVLVSGGGRAAARKAVRGQVASGAAQVVIGTHVPCVKLIRHSSAAKVAVAWDNLSFYLHSSNPAARIRAY